MLYEGLHGGSQLQIQGQLYEDAAQIDLRAKALRNHKKQGSIRHNKGSPAAGH